VGIAPLLETRFASMAMDIFSANSVLAFGNGQDLPSFTRNGAQKDDDMTATFRPFLETFLVSALLALGAHSANAACGTAGRNAENTPMQNTPVQNTAGHVGKSRSLVTDESTAATTDTRHAALAERPPQPPAPQERSEGPTITPSTPPLTLRCGPTRAPGS
jgi:hypothetical protein